MRLNVLKMIWILKRINTLHSGELLNMDLKRKNINPDLKCPMNYLCDLELNKFRNTTTTLPMSNFFVKHKLEEDRRKMQKG